MVIVPDMAGWRLERLPVVPDAPWLDLARDDDGSDRTFAVHSPGYPSGHEEWERAQAILDGRCHI